MSLILTDVAVQRQVLLERFKAAEVRKYTTVLRQVDAEIRRQLSGGRLTDFRRARLETQLAGIQQTLRGQFREYVDLLNNDLRALAVDTAGFEANLFSVYAPATVSIATPAPGQLWSAVTTNPLTMTGANGGQLLESFMQSWADGDAEMVTNAIRVGYSLGETNEQIIGRIRGQAALNFKDGVLATNRAHAETVTRTAIQHVANSARAAVWAENDDIIDEYEWVSTLDSRTTPLCRDRDGKRFPVGAGPLPPAHPNCRSTTVAVIKGEFGRLLEEEAERASVNGPVPAGETYYEWLQRQDAGFQDLALGPTRGKLFRDGGLSTDDFSRLQLGKNFEPLTLDEMRELEPQAFQRAGLNIPPKEPVAVGPISEAEAKKLLEEGRLTTAVEDVTATKAFTYYTGSGSIPMNEVLRTGAFPVGERVDEIKSYIDVIAEHLEQSTMRETATLYRGFSAQPLIDKIVERDFGGDPFVNAARGLTWEFDPKRLIGEVFEDPGFMSFTASRSIATNFTGRRGSGIAVKLVARAGDRGYAGMMGLSQVPGEYEVVRKGGRFKIVEVDEDGFLLIEALL